MNQFTLAAIDLAHPETAGQILTKAHMLAEAEGLLLAVITVVPDFGMSIVGSFFKEGTQDEVMRQANERLHAVVASTLGDKAKVKHIVKQGSAYVEILETANDIDVSLIVMGAHKPGLGDYLLGPNAARVVRHAQVSVYVVRGE